MSIIITVSQEPMSDLTNEQLLALVRERGLANEEPPQEIQNSLAMKLSAIKGGSKELISTAQSVRFLPQTAKTELMDVAMDHLLQIQG